MASIGDEFDQIKKVMTSELDKKAQSQAARARNQLSGETGRMHQVKADGVAAWYDDKNNYTLARQAQVRPSISFTSDLYLFTSTTTYKEMDATETTIMAAPTPSTTSAPIPTNRSLAIGEIVRWAGSNAEYQIVGINHGNTNNPIENVYAVRNLTTGEVVSAAHRAIIEAGGGLLIITKTKRTVTKKKAAPKPPSITFDSVIMSDEKKQQILEALEQIHQGELIFETWGFGTTVEKGRGVAMLFYGEPGTGKTLMAEAIAKREDKKLRIVATADVESSKPGEAERNIRKHFDDAKADDAILLFDECDSLIYSREHVGTIMGAQVNELLTQIERFDGITLFTTNRLGTLDEAVNRRLALKLEFSLPTPAERMKIWLRMIPKTAPIATDVDFEVLSQIEVSGGYIKNAVLRAARSAACEKVADSKKKITMAHFVRALTFEAGSMVDFDKARQEFGTGFRNVVHGGGEIEVVQG